MIDLPAHIDEAVAVVALRSAAVHYDDPDHPDFGRSLIHCFLGGFGADWDLDDAIRLLSQATDIAWVDSIVRHDLAVVANRKAYYFDVKRPAEVDQ